MTHLDSGALQTLLDHELTGADRTTVDAHVGACDTCSAELAELRSASAEWAGAVALLDVAAPMLETRVRIEQAHGQAIRHLTRRLFSVAGMAPAALARAAAVILLLAGAASAAIPGSPVRRWASELLDRATRLFGAETPSAPATPVGSVQPGAPAPTATQQPFSGVGAALANGAIQISLHSVAEGARISIRYTDARSASVDAFPPISEPPQYRSSAGRIDVFGVDRAGIVVTLPRSAQATIEVNGRLYYSRRNGEERILAPGAQHGEDGITFQMRS